MKQTDLHFAGSIHRRSDQRVRNTKKSSLQKRMRDDVLNSDVMVVTVDASRLRKDEDYPQELSIRKWKDGIRG